LEVSFAYQFEAVGSNAKTVEYFPPSFLFAFNPPTPPRPFPLRYRPALSAAAEICLSN
jgi:hypothetical protein